MKYGKILTPLIGLVLLGVAYRTYGWAGVALVGGVLVMFLLLTFNRAMQVLRRAGDAPIGYVASAVMLNAKLKPKVSLMHVMALTRALGELRTVKNEQPEIYRWTDTGGSWVEATFVEGKLTEWKLVRPEVAADGMPVPVEAPPPV